MVATDVASRGIGMYHRHPTCPSRPYPILARSNGQHLRLLCFLLLCLGALLIARTCLTSCLFGIFEWSSGVRSAAARLAVAAALVIPRFVPLRLRRGTQRGIELIYLLLDPGQTVSKIPKARGPGGALELSLHRRHTFRNGQPICQEKKVPEETRERSLAVQARPFMLERCYTRFSSAC